MSESVPTKTAMPVANQVTVLGDDGGENLFDGTSPERKVIAVHRAELHSFTIEKPWAEALVYAGGGYTKLIYDKEGVEVAAWLNGLGLDAHVLVHRLPGAEDFRGGVYPKDIALTDALSALDHLSKTPARLPLFHVGLSSGGHLAGVMACQEQAPQQCRGAIIAYAPINANHREHKFPEGKPDYPPVEKQDFYDDWPVGLEGFDHAMPKVPVFLAYGLHDRTVPVQHALRLIETAARHDLDVDAHIFSDAPHGFALRDGSGTHAVWPQLAADWMKAKV